MARWFVPASSTRAFAVLRRDASRGEHDDVERQVELCRIMWWMRHVVLATALAYELADGHLQATGIAVCVAFGLDIAGHLLVARRPLLARPVIAVDAVTLVAVAAIGVPALLVLAMGVAMLAWAATYRPAAAVAAYAGVTVAVWVAYAVHDDHHASTGFLAFSMLGAIFVVRMVRLNMGARRAAEREHLVAQGVDAIVWEAIPDVPGALKVSPAVERLLGYDVAAFEQPGFLRGLLHPDDRSTPSVVDPQGGGALGDADVVRLRRADGTYGWFENHSSIVGDTSGNDGFLVGVLVDRTDEMATERNALALGHLMAGSPIGQVMLSRRGDDVLVDAINPACVAILGVEGDAIGRSLRGCVAPGLADRLLAIVQSPTEHGELTGVDGRIYEATARRLDESSCSIDFLDVTERIEHARRLHEQARRDDLTGLANRRCLIESLEQRVTGRPGQATALLMIDLDDFKEVNDALGHETGDQLLVEIGRRLAGAVGDAELAARLGGDEFAVLLPGTERADAAERAERIVELLNQPVGMGDLRLRVRASVGLAACPEDASDASELVRRADVAMYAAKHRGTSVEPYDPTLDPYDRDRLALAAELEDAIASDELELHHQPVIDVASGRIVGTEALVRWIHPRHGMIHPIAFIELAEVSGLIRPLTRWVARRAMRDLATFGTSVPGGDELEVSVNLSVRNLYEHDLIDWIRDTLGETGVAADRLVVEITESMIMEDQHTAVEVLEGLRSLGVRVWIDDFGTGHSSFSRLRELPVDGVKIDRSFVTGAPHHDSDRIVLQNLIDLVRSLGLESIAEGVEEEEHLDLLRRLGCRTAQGYFIARPMPASEIRAMLRAGERSTPVLGPI